YCPARAGRWSSKVARVKAETGRTSWHQPTVSKWNALDRRDHSVLLHAGFSSAHRNPVRRSPILTGCSYTVRLARYAAWPRTEEDWDAKRDDRGTNLAGGTGFSLQDPAGSRRMATTRRGTTPSAKSNQRRTTMKGIAD